MRRTPNVIDGRRVKVKTHLQIGSRTMCNQSGGQRMTFNHDRVDCLRCLRYPKRVMPGIQAMTRIHRDGGGVVESPVVAYRPDLGEFVYIGPLPAVAALLCKDRFYWDSVTPDGKWTVALCEDPNGEVFVEVGQSTDHNLALRIAVAAYLTPVQEWRIAEEVMW